MLSRYDFAEEELELERRVAKVQATQVASKKKTPALKEAWILWVRAGNCLLEEEFPH